MNYGKIDYCDSANGIGARVTLFVSGCTHHCKGCFQPETWDFNYGKPFTDKEIEKIIFTLKPKYYNGLSILGGEPMEKCNQPYVLKLISKLKEECPDKTIWIYSGYTLDELQDKTNKRTYVEGITDEILSLIDVLVDGEFVEELFSIGLAFRGSSNQRVIDMKKSLKERKVILLDTINDKFYD